MRTFQPSSIRPFRLQVRFSEDEVARLQARATELGLPLTATVRSLTLSALAGARDPRLDELEAVGVAALMAGEHAVQLVQLLIPAGARRSADLAAAVHLGALERLAQVRRDLEEAQP